MKTITRWKKHMQFESRQNDYVMKLDGEGKSGHGPKALLLAGLAGCSGIDVVDILKKMRVEFSSLEMETEATQTNDHPKVFKEIRIKYIIATDAKNKENVKKAVALSLEKYCGVAAMLKKNSPIHFTIEIIK